MLIIFFILSTIQALSTGIDGNKEICFEIYGQEKDEFWLGYVVSGFQEDNIELNLFSPNKELLKSIIKQKEGNLKLNAQQTGIYTACFKSLDKYYKLISFDFDSWETQDDYLAQASTMEELATNAKAAYKSMQTISQNQKYQYDRESEHQKMLDSTESKIWWCSSFKIISLIVICFSQIYMLTGFFKGKSFAPNV